MLLPIHPPAARDSQSVVGCDPEWGGSGLVPRFRAGRQAALVRHSAASKRDAPFASRTTLARLAAAGKHTRHAGNRAGNGQPPQRAYCHANCHVDPAPGDYFCPGWEHSNGGPAGERTASSRDRLPQRPGPSLAGLPAPLECATALTGRMDWPGGVARRFVGSGGPLF